MSDSPFERFPRSVIWTRGDGCELLARLVTTETATRAEADLPAACLGSRADLVVMSSAGSFDLVATASPVSLDTDKVTHVAAAVGGGPHSRLAALIAARIATGLDVPGELLSGFRDEDGRPGAETAIAETTAASGLPGRTVMVKSAAALVESLPPGALLVLGSPGGSWLQRQFFGPGARLTSAAPGGAVVVRDAPVRAFHVATRRDGLGRHMRVGDARLVGTGLVLPVVDEGKLVGVVRLADLDGVDPDTPLGSMMETAPLASVFDTLDDLAEMEEFYKGSAVPVVDREGRLYGDVEVPYL